MRVFCTENEWRMSGGIKYRILVRSLTSDSHLTYHVNSFELVEGFVMFTDVKTGQTKRYHGSNCEIEEVRV